MLPRVIPYKDVYMLITRMNLIRMFVCLQVR